MGSPVGLLVDIPGESMKFGLEGKVVWVNATGMNLGVGVQCTESPSLLQFKVKTEVLLAGLDRTKNATYTFCLYSVLLEQYKKHENPGFFIEAIADFSRQRFPS